MKWKLENLFYLLAKIYFSLFFLTLEIIQAQDIKPFPIGRSITPLSANVHDEHVYELTMSGATTNRDNQTICTGFLLPTSPNEFWIIQFEGKASASVVHHMTLYGCDTVQTTNPCGCGMPSRSPLYSWVRYTPKVRYTGSGEGSTGGFRVGGSTDNQFLFLEIHYCHASSALDQSGITIHTTTNSTSYDLGIFPVMGKGTIPANQANFTMDTCTTSLPSVFDGNLEFFGFQVHSHNLGRLISAYYVSNYEVMAKIGQGNPLWPEGYVEIPKADQKGPNSGSGDSIITRCIFDSRGASGDTNTNGLPQTNWSEMCIFNVLVKYYTSFSTKNAFLTGTCSSSAFLDSQSSSTSLLTPIPDLDIAAAYGNITSGKYPFGSDYSINMEGETFSVTLG